MEQYYDVFGALLLMAGILLILGGVVAFLQWMEKE